MKDYLNGIIAVIGTGLTYIFGGGHRDTCASCVYGTGLLNRSNGCYISQGT